MLTKKQTALGALCSLPSLGLDRFWRLSLFEGIFFFSGNEGVPAIVPWLRVGLCANFALPRLLLSPPVVAVRSVGAQ